MTNETPVWIALTADKVPIRAGMLNGPSATKPATDAELKRAPMRGIVPRSIGLVCVDIDTGELPPAERVKSLVRALGEPCATIPSARSGGVHLYYAADCDFTSGTFNLGGRVAGDVKHDRQFAVVYDTATLETARLKAKAGEAATLTRDQLRVLCAGWSEGERHDTMLRKSFSFARRGHHPAFVGKLAQEAGLPRGEIDRAISQLPVAQLAGGSFKLSELEWARLFRQHVGLANRDGRPMRWQSFEGWTDGEALDVAETFGDFASDKLAGVQERGLTELHRAIASAELDNATAKKLLANVNGIGALIVKCGGANFIQNVAKLAIGAPDARPWNADPFTVGLPGCRKLNLRTGDVLAARADDRLTMALGAAPGGGDVGLVAAWNGFLRNTIGSRADGVAWDDAAERLAYAQLLFGAMLIGNNDLEAITVLVGDEGTGKTTIREAVMKAFGTYAMALNGSDVVGTSHQHNEHKMPLRDKRICGIGELPATANAWRCDTVKSISSGDTIRANWMRQNSVTFRPVAKLFITTNELPTASGTVKGMRRRLRIFRIDHKLPMDGSKTVTLADDMVPVIVAWLAEGARLYLAHGLPSRPVSLADEVRTWASDNDIFGLFFDDIGLVATGDHDADSVTIGDLREAWAQWTTRQGVRLSANAMMSAVRSAPWNAGDGRGGPGKRRVLTGVRMGTGAHLDMADVPF